MAANRQPLRRARGLTLIELMITVTILALVMGVTISMLMTSMRVWRRCSSFSQAFPPAYAVIGRLNKELKNAYYVNVPPEKDSITFRVPRSDEAGFNAVPLQMGHEITYYRSNDSGDQGEAGTLLWRQDYNALTGITRNRVIAENVTRLEFDCVKTYDGRVFSVYSNAVTVIGKEQHAEHESSFETHIAIRNPQVEL
ncbi:MAG: PilW family protein [Armatimonadota bacterium]